MDTYNKAVKRTIIGTSLVLIIVLYLANLIPIAVVMTLSLITSYLIFRAKLKNLGIEFVTLSAVLAGVLYGPVAGAAVALFLMSIHIGLAQYIGPYILWVIPEFMLIGALAGIIEADFVMLGVGLSILAHSIGLVFTLIFSKGFISRFIPYAITNIIFNYIIFSIAVLFI